jgi:dihydroorotate dehydrogenase (fumarate)
MSGCDLSTTYLGFHLKNPLVPAASPLSGTLDNIKRMEDAGAGALVLPSLFEEQLEHDSYELDYFLSHGTYSYSEAVALFAERTSFPRTPDQYLELVQAAKRTITIPVIASLNGASSGTWIEHARDLQNAGADALEVNLYSLSTDPFMASADIEREYVEMLRIVKRSVTMPVAVKLTPFFTNLPAMARRLDEAGADGLVLFNRFQQPDVDLDRLELVPRPALSPADDALSLRLPLNWIAILYPRVRASLAASSGVHSAEDVLKLLLVGASSTMLASELMLRGIERLREIRDDLARWMERYEYASIRHLQGSLSQEAPSLPAAFERAQYVRAVSGGGD